MAKNIAKDFKDAGISMVSGDKYKDFVEERTAMIMMFAEWCPHCVAAKPAYLDLAAKVEAYNQKASKKNQIYLGAIDFDLKSTEAFKKEFDAYMVPTFAMFASTGATKIYSGDRTSGDLFAKLREFEKEERKKYGMP